MKNKKRQTTRAQVTIEFTFCLIIVLLLIYGCIMAFRWAGVSLAERRISHDTTINASVNELWEDLSMSPAKQLTPDFYKPKPMNMVFNNW